jgi:argininosuccinate lyase
MAKSKKGASPSRSRLRKPLSKAAQDYTTSLAYDRRLYKHDIAGSIAHARMLARQGIITEKEAEALVMGLSSIRQEIEQGTFPFRPELEDIHLNIEGRLQEKVGPLAGKLHTARSRNDQVALDMRLFVKEAIGQTVQGIMALQKALIAQAGAALSQKIIMPGYTHLQRAQPVLLAHHWLAYFEMLLRDKERLQDCLKRTDVLPLGSGALAGVPYSIDREWVARELGFSRISQNSLDAVSDRDFVLEYLASASITMLHLSRLAEELVLWSTEEFGYLDLDEAYTTGSSIMPQKKNADPAELARGRAGRLFGHLMALLTTLKGLPLAYNRDLQEDKEGLFDAVDTLNGTLHVLSGMVETLTLRPERMRRAAEGGFALATDLADWLVKKGVPFREAHGIVGSLVAYAVEHGKGLKELSLEEYRRFSRLFNQEALDLLSAETSVQARDVPGGTAPRQVARALQRAKKALK